MLVDGKKAPPLPAPPPAAPPLPRLARRPAGADARPPPPLDCADALLTVRSSGDRRGACIRRAGGVGRGGSANGEPRCSNRVYTRGAQRAKGLLRSKRRLGEW